MSESVNHTATDHSSGDSHLSSLLNDAQQLLGLYGSQLSTVKALVREELKLNMKLIVLTCMLVLGATLALFALWGGMLGLLALGLSMMGMPLWSIIALPALLHLAATWYLVRSLRGAIRRLGFGRTVTVLKDHVPNFQRSTEPGSNSDTAPDQTTGSFAEAEPTHKAA